jgi:hypothetical protein
VAVVTAPICGFLKDQGDPPSLQRCNDAATCLAYAPEIGEWVPSCDACGEGRQVKRPQEIG